MVGSLVQRTKCQLNIFNVSLMELSPLIENLVMISNFLIVLRLVVIQLTWVFLTENIQDKMDVQRATRTLDSKKTKINAIEPAGRTIAPSKTSLSVKSDACATFLKKHANIR